MTHAYDLVHIDRELLIFMTFYLWEDNLSTSIIIKMYKNNKLYVLDISFSNKEKQGHSSFLLLEKEIDIVISQFKSCRLLSHFRCYQFGSKWMTILSSEKIIFKLNSLSWQIIQYDMLLLVKFKYNKYIFICIILYMYVIRSPKINKYIRIIFYKLFSYILKIYISTCTHIINKS